jgi:hypothetical protein
VGNFNATTQIISSSVIFIEERKPKFIFREAGVKPLALRLRHLCLTSQLFKKCFSVPEQKKKHWGVTRDRSSCTAALAMNINAKEVCKTENMHTQLMQTVLLPTISLITQPRQMADIAVYRLTDLHTFNGTI